MVEIIDTRDGQHFLFSGAEAIEVLPDQNASRATANDTQPEAKARSVPSWLSVRKFGFKRGDGDSGDSGTAAQQEAQHVLAAPVCQVPYIRVSTFTGSL